MRLRSHHEDAGISTELSNIPATPHALFKRKNNSESSCPQKKLPIVNNLKLHRIYKKQKTNKSNENHEENEIFVIKRCFH
jgi:hypothetical protein